MIAATQSNHPLGTVSSGNVPSPVELGCERLKAGGMRITKPRIALLEALGRHSAPLAIEQLHQELSRNACDLVTVYRCLAVFEQVGIVRRSFLHNGTAQYELTLSGAPKRYNVVCKSCGAAEPVDYFPFEGIHEVLRERGYANLSHLVEFFGVCPACQQANTKRHSH